mmetsp:Transcript_73015/g.188353  ORF Transcript_73015/g.188353 Transcript_73015/m.188353 type:complete len:233 (+) Transcript_73015:239-937(+)
MRDASRASSSATRGRSSGDSSLTLVTISSMAVSSRLSNSPSEPRMKRSPSSTSNEYVCACSGSSSFRPRAVAAFTAWTSFVFPAATSSGYSFGVGMRESWKGWPNLCCCSCVRSMTVIIGAPGRRRSCRRLESPRLATPTSEPVTSRAAMIAVAAPNAVTPAWPSAIEMDARFVGGMGPSCRRRSAVALAPLMTPSANSRGFMPKRQPHSETPSAMPTAEPWSQMKKASSPP